MADRIDAVKEASDSDKEAVYAEITQEPYYATMKELLQTMKKAADIAYLYVFVPYDDHFIYIVEGQIPSDNPNKINKIGQEYAYTTVEYKHLVEDVKNRQPSREPILAGDDFFGRTLSAWAPVTDDSGNVIAMVEADVSLDVVYDVLYGYVFTMMGLIIVLILLSVAGLFYMTKRIIINPIAHLNRKVIEYAQDDELWDLENEIFTGDEIQELSESVIQMAEDIKRYMNNLETVTAEREKVATELNVAKHIQASMLPSIFPPFPDRQDFDIYAIMNPAKEVGGDFYDFFMLGEDKVAFVMADVSGKGVPAALFMMIAKGTIKDFALTNLEVNDIFKQANNRLNENNDTFMFVTAFMGILDLKTGVLSYVNAGHNPPLIYRKGKGFDWLEMHRNQVLAIMPGAEFPKQEVQLEPGDMLFTYTDGVTEAISDVHTFYSEERLIELLNQEKEPDKKHIMEIVLDVRHDIDVFANGAEQADDITILLFKYDA